MKRFTILWSHQLWQMFIAPSTYIAAFMFLTFMAVMYLFSLVDISMSASDVSPLGKFLSVFWVPVLFMVPLLTMRSIAEERRMGTLATLMTTPVTAGQIVLAKFLACYFFYILLWIMTLFFPLITELYIPNSIRARRIDADVATVDRLRVYFYKRGYVYCHRDFCQFTYKDDPRGGDAFVWNALFCDCRRGARFQVRAA